MVKKEKKNNLRFKKIIDCLILRLNENRDKMNRERESGSTILRITW